MNSLTAMGLAFLALSWSAVVASGVVARRARTARQDLAADALMYAAVPLCLLAVVGCAMGVVVEVTP